MDGDVTFERTWVSSSSLWPGKWNTIIGKPLQYHMVAVGEKKFPEEDKYCYSQAK